MQGSARKDVVFGAAGVYPVTVPGPKWKSWLRCVKVGRNDPCPCGSGKKYKKCHRSVTATTGPGRTPPPDDYSGTIDIKPGETPQWLKRLVKKPIKHVFDGDAGFEFGGSRGELCANVALLIIWLLRQYGVQARFVVGSARWNNYPLWFDWKGEREYHAWVQTEFNEIVDLACDALSTRSNLPQPILSPSPQNCWVKRDELTDRVYREVANGARELDVDCPGSKAFEILATAALKFATRQERVERT